MLDNYNGHGAEDEAAVSSVVELRAELADVRERLDAMTRERDELKLGLRLSLVGAGIDREVIVQLRGILWGMVEAVDRLNGVSAEDFLALVEIARAELKHHG